MTEVKYATEPPTEPGTYFFRWRRCGSDHVRRMIRRPMEGSDDWADDDADRPANGTLAWFCPRNGPKRVAHFIKLAEISQWFGPLPELPKDEGWPNE